MLYERYCHYQFNEEVNQVLILILMEYALREYMEQVKQEQIDES